MLDETPIPRKMARLYLISDILHNSAASIHNVWRYRSSFESQLPSVFDHLSLIYKSFPGRMKAEAFRQQIASVISVWEAWLIFTPAVISDFHARLVGGDVVSDDIDIDGIPTEPMVIDGTDLDGEVMVKSGFKRVGAAAH